jgi:2-iminobutanoate/2-iminopropanoate deaminase
LRPGTHPSRSVRTRRPWWRTASSTAAARCLESLAAVCREAGTRLQDAARIGIYLTDMEEFSKVNDVYATFFEKPFPVRTTVGVAALPKGALVEMDATVPLAT